MSSKNRDPEGDLPGRERSRLRLARENGYLRARATDNQKTVKAFSLWCWRLKVPMVWSEPRTARSRYGRVVLDMFTTTNMLTAAGQAKMEALGAARASPHDACWERVPVRDLERLSKEVFRAVTRAESQEPNRSKLIADLRRPGKLFQVA